MPFTIYQASICMNRLDMYIVHVPKQCILFVNCAPVVWLLDYYLLLYSVRNWNTPMIFDLKNGNITLIVQTEK